MRIAMLIRGAMRTAIWALAALILVFGGGLALFRSLFQGHPRRSAQLNVW